MKSKLWGDNFYDPVAKKWTKEPVSAEGKPLQRGFVQFIMDPIIRLTKAILVEDRKEDAMKMIANLNIVLTEKEREMAHKQFYRAVF